MARKEQRSHQQHRVSVQLLVGSFSSQALFRVILFSATLFAKSKNILLSHLFADVLEEEGGGKGGGKKKGGGSMQTISATHRVSYFSRHCAQEFQSIVIEEIMTTLFVLFY